MKRMNKLKLKYYAFDWDDNLMHLDTKIILEKKINNVWSEIKVSTSEFAKFRLDSDYRIPHINGKEDAEYAFKNFRDNSNHNIFLNDCIKAFETNSFGKSLESFKKCLINGNLFAIITARGHSPQSIRESVKYLIENLLTRQERNIMFENLFYFQKLFTKTNVQDPLSFYLDNCQFTGVSSPDFINNIEQADVPEGHTFSPENTELGKQIAISKFFKNRINAAKNLNDNFEISFGFSDDDIKNIESIKDVFMNLKKSDNTIKYVLYDTSKNLDGTINYNKIVI